MKQVCITTRSPAAPSFYLLGYEGFEEAVKYLSEGEGQVSISSGHNLLQRTANHLNRWLRVGKQTHVHARTYIDVLFRKLIFTYTCTCIRIHVCARQDLQSFSVILEFSPTLTKLCGGYDFLVYS